MAGVSSLRDEMPWSANQIEKRRYMFDTGFLSDVTLFLGPQKQEVKAHRLFLEMASPIFCKIFQQVRKNELIINDVDPEIFKKFLQYIYLGECEAAVGGFLPLFEIATKYKVQDLIDFCTEKLKGDICLDNVTTLFQQAMKFGHQQLTEETLAYFCKNGKKLVKTESFLEFRQECLYEILERDHLRVRSELELFNAVLRSKGEGQRQKMDHEVLENVSRVLAKVLGLIKFPNMDAEELSLNVATRKLLLNDELISLLLFFNVSIEKRNKIPPGRFNATPRKYLKIDQIYTVSRNSVTAKNSLCYGEHESLQLEVSKQISLVGLKIFVHPACREDIQNDFSNLICTVLIESVPSGTFLHKKEIKEFNFFKTIDLESVELQPNSLYQITLSRSGSYKFCCGDGKIREQRYLCISEGLQSSCSLEYEGEDGIETVHFQFSRGSSSELPLKRGIIEDLVFTI